jgi:hypothetical protein
MEFCMKLSYAIVQRFPCNGTRYAVWRSANLGGTREYLQANGADAIFPTIQAARDAMRAWSKEKVAA